MSGWSRLRRRIRHALAGWIRAESPAHPPCASPLDVPLPVLVHRHPKQAVPPGPLEEGMVELEQDGFVLHIVEAVLRSDGTIGDLPPEKLEWARCLSYRHLKREGWLEQSQPDKT